MIFVFTIGYLCGSSQYPINRETGTLAMYYKVCAQESQSTYPGYKRQHQLIVSVDLELVRNLFYGRLTMFKLCIILICEQFQQDGPGELHPPIPPFFVEIKLDKPDLLIIRLLFWFASDDVFVQSIEISTNAVTASRDNCFAIFQKWFTILPDQIVFNLTPFSSNLSHRERIEALDLIYQTGKVLGLKVYFRKRQCTKNPRWT